MNEFVTVSESKTVTAHGIFNTNNTKWYLDVNEMKFYNQKTGEMAPKSIQKILKNKDVINAINKGLKFLGE